MLPLSDGDYVLHTDYAALEARCAGLERERDELQLAFDRSHDANMRGINAWQKATGKELVWPDQGNLVEWLLSERDALQAKLAAAEEALKPSAETKAEYMGEFSWKEESLDEYEEPCLRTIYVPWTTIKEIMKAIKARAALADTTTDEVQP